MWYMLAGIRPVEDTASGVAVKPSSFGPGIPW